MNEPLLEFEIKPQNITRGEDGRLRFTGIAMFENAISGNGRFYPAEFIDESIARTSKWLEQGHATTMHKSHEAWMRGDLPIGAVFTLKHEGGKMLFDAQISPTKDGSDMMTLIEDKVMSRVSLRSTQYESKMEKLEGESLDVMKWAVFEGIDFCERPGIQGAGIIKILEAAPKWAEENNMNWDEITLEALRENRPDLLEGYLRDALGAFVAERDELKTAVTEGAATVETLNAQVAELTAKAGDTAELDATKLRVEELLSVQKELEWKLERFEAAAPKWVAGLVEEVAQCDPTVLAKEVSEKKDAILAAFLAEHEPKGKGRTVTEDDEDSTVPRADNLVSSAVLLNTH